MERLPSDSGHNGYDRWHDLGDLVLLWSLQRISTEFHVNKIPEKFGSVKKYLTAFRFPLLEETRAEMYSSLQDVQNAPQFKLLDVLPIRDDEFFLDIDLHESDSHITRKGDLFFLCSTAPREAKEFQLNKDITIAMAIEMGMHDSFQRGFRVKTGGSIGSKNFKYALFLCNILRNAQIWKSLITNLYPGTIIERLLKPPPMVEEMNCDTCVVEETIDSLTSRWHNLDESQQDVARMIISVAQCNHDKSVKVIRGAPGTGKTKIISTVLEALQGSGTKVLVCAPNIFSFATLCSNLLEIIKSSHKHEWLPGCMGDILLLCDDTLEGNPDLCSFSINKRVEEVMPSMLWKRRIHGLISLLRTFKEKYACAINHKEVPVSAVDLLSFLLKEKVVILKKDIRTLWTNFPKDMFSEGVTKRMESLPQSLNTLYKLLSHIGATANDVKAAFGIFVSPSYVMSELGEDIETAKRKCLDDLEYLHDHLGMPFEKDISWLRKFCIKSAKVILCTASSSFELHDLHGNPNLLIVDGADEIKECDLIVPLSLCSIKHVVLIGDDNQLRPKVKSQVNKEVGFGETLVGRLMLLRFSPYLLKKQYRMHPRISKFPNAEFYGDCVLDGTSDSAKFSSLPFGNYCFINIADKGGQNITNSERKMLEFAASLHLTNIIFKAWKKEKMAVEIGLVYPCSSQVQATKLTVEDRSNNYDGFNVCVKSIDELEEELDVLVVATCEFPDDDRMIKSALTKARYCLWILGNETNLARHGILWKNLLEDAKNRGCFFEATNHKTLSAALNDQQRLYALSSKYILSTKPTLGEFTWLGRPHHGKFILPPLRDQKAEGHCTAHASLGALEFLNKYQSASSELPADFNVTFSTKHLLDIYEEKVGIMGKETGDVGKGSKRLETVLHILQTEGARSHNPFCKTAYKISSYCRTYRKGKDTVECLQNAIHLLREGKISVGGFKISRNYMRFKPGEVYVFDPKHAILTPITNQPCSHVVMIIGGGENCAKDNINKPSAADSHFVLQNSYGSYFGEEGIGRVRGDSVTILYQINL